jgi:hypothetical protein
MNRTHILYLVILIISLISCNNDTNDRYMTDYFEKEKYNPEIIKEQKVTERTEIEIHTDPEIPIIVWSNGKEISPNKIKKIEYFDDNGLCYLKVNPVYKLIENNKVNYNKLSELDKIFYQKEIQGNEPSGFYDSTYNFFDKKNRLIKVKEVHRNMYGQLTYDMTQTYTFDEKNNLTLLCSESQNSQSLCRYVMYDYDSKGTIKSSKDSFSVLMNDRRPNSNIIYKYTYDSKNRISSINNKHFVYDNNNLIIEEFDLSGDTKLEIINKKYDQNKNNVQRKWIRSTLSTFDPKTNLSIVHRYDTSRTYNKFNNLNLITESSHQYSTSTNKYNLYKYEYKFR